MTYGDEYIVTCTCRKEIRQDFQKWLVITAVQFLRAQRARVEPSPFHVGKDRVLMTSATSRMVVHAQGFCMSAQLCVFAVGSSENDLFSSSSTSFSTKAPLSGG